MKYCPWCREWKPDSEYWHRTRSADGLQQWCKSCRRAWRMSYREIEREQDRLRYQKRHLLTSRSIAGDTGEQRG